MGALRNLFVVWLFVVAAAYCADGDTETESYLRIGHEYPDIVHVQSPYEYLQAHVESLMQQLATQPSSEHDEIFLRIGDAYHWMGHIAEERNQNIEAARLFADSIRAYRESSIQTSPRINDLEPVLHMVWHMGTLYQSFIASGATMPRFDDFVNSVFQGTGNTQNSRELRARCQQYFGEMGRLLEP